MLNTTNDDNISLKSETSDNCCSVCLYSLKTNVKVLDCKHSFHENCINEWLKAKNNCPLCRYPIKTVEISISIPNNIPSNTNIPRRRTKNIITTKNILLILFSLFVLVNFCSSFYMYAITYKIRSVVYPSENSNDSSSILLLIDIFYVLAFIFCSSNLIFNKLNNRYNNKGCSAFVILIIYIINIVFHQSYIRDGFDKTNKYQLGIKYQLVIATVLFGSSYFLKTMCLFFIGYIY